MTIWTEMSKNGQGRSQYLSALIYFTSVDRPGEGYLRNRPELPYVFNFVLRHAAPFTAQTIASFRGKNGTTILLYNITSSIQSPCYFYRFRK